MNKKIYNKPVVAISAVCIEKGFAASDADAWNDGNNGGDWTVGTEWNNEFE